jgi:hypothetical protein
MKSPETFDKPFPEPLCLFDENIYHLCTRVKFGMRAKITSGVVFLVIMLMTFECITAAFIPTEQAKEGKTSIHSSSKPSSLFGAYLCERTEEEERSEGERDKFLTIELVDLSRIATFLSFAHTPHHTFAPYEHLFGEQAQLFKMFCVYLI